MIPIRLRLAGFLTVAQLAFAPSARAADVDWKFYGGADVAMTGRTVCFYEERGITRPMPHIVDVWTKCLLQKDMDNVPAGALYKNAWMSMSAGRIAHYYVPPVAKIERMNVDQLEQVVMYESLADVGDQAAHAEFYYELDCRHHMMHMLSGAIEYHAITPTEWEYVPPEGNASRLLSLLCQ